MNTRAKADRTPSEGVVGDLGDHHSDIFFAAVQTTRMPMLVTDPRQPDNPVVFANLAFLAMTGYSGDEVVGHNCRFLQGPETDPATVDVLRAAIARRQDAAVEILNYRKDGSTFWNALFIAPIFNKAGELVLFFSSQLDVSRRRDAEDSLARARRLEALGHLTGGIAHDFNNLLQIVVGQLDMIGAQLKRRDVNDAAVELAIDRAVGAAERASSLTQQLLAFARRQRLAGRVVSLNALARGLSELAARTLGENFPLEVHCADDVPHVELDPTQFEVAVLNLLVNARDAMPSGGGIRVTTGRETVDAERGGPEGLASGEYAVLEVADQGEGIAPELLTRVIDPFFTTKAERGGSGLGLSTIYGFAQQSGGTLTIRSELGAGTRVRLYFPATSKPLDAAALSAHAASPRGGGEEILVVDDRIDVADLTAAMLGNLGYRTRKAHSGAEALALLRNQEVDPALLVSDVVMPGSIDGYALARAARQLNANLPVLLVSGFDSDPQRLQSVDRSAEVYVLRKPYRLEELARVVRMLLDGATGATLNRLKQRPARPSGEP